MNNEIKQLNAKAEKYSESLTKVSEEIKKVIVGQEEVIQKLLISLIANGHVLLEGVPGLAKTLMIKTLGETMDANFKRIQFTPDLLPADIIGTKIYNQKTASFTTKKGPIFTNFLLADEINRAPPKVQSALLEAMQEKQVTIGDESYKIDHPFFVLATQNPLEHEGVYSLPEAQVDRFMFKVFVKYPTKEEEYTIIDRMTANEEPKPKKAMDAKQIIEIQKFVREIYVDEKIKGYVTNIVDSTRNPDKYKLEVDGLIECGASPRATIWLILAGKAHALLNGRGYVIPEDIKAVSHDVLRHRIILSYEAEAEGIKTDDIIEKIMKNVKVP
jgi:MoxR-like ATPase